jgi:hypothetical protein
MMMELEVVLHIRLKNDKMKREKNKGGRGGFWTIVKQSLTMLLKIMDLWSLHGA